MLIEYFKSLARMALCPKSISFKTARKIQLPHSIYNADCISIGERFSMREHAVINPLKGVRPGGELPSISIGDDVYIGGYFQIHCIGKITIGNGVVISEYVYISDVSHGLLPDAGLIMKQPLASKGGVNIGANSFLGHGVAVMPGVTLGENCVVGTNSVVTKSFPAGSMIAGQPARLIKRFNYIDRVWEAI
jgi:acetyltransferase-like isoleucine patch superfamily enzyme